MTNRLALLAASVNWVEIEKILPLGNPKSFTYSVTGMGARHVTSGGLVAQLLGICTWRLERVEQYHVAIRKKLKVIITANFITKRKNWTAHLSGAREFSTLV